MKPRLPSKPEMLFYDGECGLCHGAVELVLARDRDGSRFRFAPLGGETFERLVPEGERAALPDSLVVQTHEGELLARSRGALHIARRLGGVWRLLAGLGRLVPRPLADWTYDLIARTRHRFFARPETACPLLPPELARRIDP